MKKIYFYLLLAGLTACSTGNKNTDTGSGDSSRTAVSSTDSSAAGDVSVAAAGDSSTQAVSTMSPAASAVSQDSLSLPPGDIVLRGIAYDRESGTGAGNFREISLSAPGNQPYRNLHIKLFDDLQADKIPAYAFFSDNSIRRIRYSDVKKALNSSYTVRPEDKDIKLFANYKAGDKVQMSFAHRDVNKIYLETRQNANYLVFCIPADVHPSGLDKLIVVFKVEDLEKHYGKKITTTFVKASDLYPKTR